MTGKVSRRGLFDAFRRVPTEPAPVEAPAGFSLSDFYARRTQAEAPVAPLRAGLPNVPTTSVGVGRVVPAGAAPAPGASVVLPKLAPGARVRVRVYACLAHSGSFCSTCSERCPVPGAIVVSRGRPTVDETLCSGCGVCVGLCPAPVNGFDIVHAEERSHGA